MSIPVGSSTQEGRLSSPKRRMGASRSTCIPCGHGSNPRRHGLASTTTAVGRVIPPRSDAVPNRRSTSRNGVCNRAIIGCVIIVAVVTVGGRRRGSRGGEVEVRDLGCSGHNSGGDSGDRDGFVFVVVVAAVVVVVVFPDVVLSDRKGCGRDRAQAGG